MVIVIVLLTILSTFLGGLFAVRFKDKLHLILGFSAGAVMGAAFFDLLPESIELASTIFEVKYITLFIALGFVGYLIIDRIFSLHLHEEDIERNNRRGKLGALTLSFHSFLDGIGIGLAFKVSPSIGWIVAAAVLSHDFSDGINTVNMILRNQGSRKTAIKWLIVDALAPAVGIISTSFYSVSEPVLGMILAVFAGLFFYIGASDLIPESQHQHPTIWTTVMTVLGIMIIYGVIRLAG